jgi:hypothetical protein
MFGNLIGALTGLGLSNPVNPEYFVTLWPTFLAASSKVEFPEGKKPSKMFDLPGVQGVVACREQMLSLGISPLEAAPYGSRLSLAKGILDEPELAEKLAAFIVSDENGNKNLKPELLAACATAPLKMTLNGPAFDVATLLETAASAVMPLPALLTA